MPEVPLRKSDFSLRAMVMDDADLILSWRNSERIRSVMYNDHVIAFDEHRAWMERVLSSRRDDYRVFEYLQRPIGLTAATEMSWHDRRCSWGYYIGVEDAPKGSGKAMEWLTLDRVFGALGMRKLCCEVFAFNERPRRLHDMFHFVEEGRFLAHRLKQGHFEDVIALALFAQTWEAHKDELASQIFLPEHV